MGDHQGQRTTLTHDPELREPFDPAHYKWQWRRRISANPVTNHSYRIAIGVVGAVVVVVGLLLVPLPGPGWLIVFLGLGVWATEFMWAARLLAFAREKVAAWNDWMRPKPLWVKGFVALLTFAFVVFFLWATFRIGGIPGFLPAAARDFLQLMPGLG